MRVFVVVSLALVTLTLTVGAFIAYALDVIPGEAAGAFVVIGIASGIGTAISAEEWGGS